MCLSISPLSFNSLKNALNVSMGTEILADEV